MNLNRKDVQVLVQFLDSLFVNDVTVPESVQVLYRRLRRSLCRIKVQSAKGKGRALQYWTAEAIARILGVVYSQKDDLCPIHSREMGQSGSDIVFRTKEVQDRFPFTVECKSTENLDLLATIQQARSNQKDGTDWLIVHKRKALSEPVVILSWSAFERVLTRKEQ